MHCEPTVVLVDDDQSVRDALKWLIESVDLRVDTYASATEFLDSFDPAAPGCLVLDVRMPGMSGLELQEILTAHRCGLPVIIISATGEIGIFFSGVDIPLIDGHPQTIISFLPIRTIRVSHTATGPSFFTIDDLSF